MSLHGNQVFILFAGYARQINESLTEANCTSVLIKGKSSCIIVDTRTAWDGQEMLAALKELNVAAADVTHVVCTHGHSDHTGCNYLFLHAKQHIVGHSISHKHNYEVLGIGEHAIDENIYVIATPGHTMDSVSVIVANSNLSANKVAICGDLFERHEDCFDKNIWLDAGSESASVQLKQRRAMAEMVDIIVPGHGPPFTVTPEIRDALKQCTLDCTS